MSFQLNPFTGNFDLVGSSSSSAIISRTAFIDLDVGNDSTGVVGNLSFPFATISGAESAITDATDSKFYVLEIGPGSHDVTGIVKKPHVNWVGDSPSATKITVSSGSLDLANAVMVSGTHTSSFYGLSFNSCPIATDAASVGGSGTATWIFDTCTFNSTQTWTGRGGNDAVIYRGNCSLQSTPNVWDSVSVYLFDCLMTADGASSHKFTDATSGSCQFFMVGTIALSTVRVEAATFCVGGVIGTVINLLEVDGTAPNIYIDSGTLITDPSFSGGATSAQILLLSQSKRVSYAPSVSGNWSPVPNIVSDALDQLAANASSSVFSQRYSLLVG
jgi:hypothetical protein